MCADLNATLDQCFPASSGVRVIAEPGRYYMAASGIIYTTVIGKRNRNSLAAMHAAVADEITYNGIGKFVEFLNKESFMTAPPPPLLAGWVPHARSTFLRKRGVFDAQLREKSP
jgi:hypothetical protein